MKLSLRQLSFQTKLLASFFLVILLATAAGYLFINRSVNRAFSDFTVRSFTAQDGVLIAVIAQYYNRTGSLDGLVDFLNHGPRNIPVLLVDPERKVVFAPDEQFVGRTLKESELAGGQPISLPSGAIWTVVPYRPLAGQNALEQEFLRTTQTALWLAGFAASAAALLLVLFLVRQTTGPLRQLEAASQRIARGKFDEQVDVRSSDEIGRLAQAFNEMATSLKLSEEAKRRMIADTSHELRTPLAAVRSALEGLRDGLVEPTPATFAALHDRVLLLTRLVGDLHQLALADAGQLSIERRPTQIRSIIDGIVETVGFQIEDGGLTLDTVLDSDLPTLLIDAHRIEQVLLNLLANAIRHTPGGGRIELRATLAAADEIELRVCDTGPGIPREDLERIFERFYRTDPSRESGGAGLGLSIAKALVEAHGGRIWAEERPEGGACFVIRLPLAAA
ncbi:MAG: ATP-binding protein [Candidatus Bipolaricaulota bacterium]|nr:ATP-binding protein [Candidatus Bipolaricaulota bacterium]